MRYIPGLLVVALLVGVYAVLAALKADSVETRRAAFLAEALLRFQPEVLWRGSWLYPGQRAGMFASYGLVQANAGALAVTSALCLAGSGAGVRLAGAGRMFLALLLAWALAPLAATWVAPGPFGGASGAVYGLCAAAFVWALRRGEREAAGAMGLAVLAGIAGHALAGGQAVALDAAGLAVGAAAGLALRPRPLAP